MLKSWWWKILSFVLLIYTCTMGFLVKIPVLDGRMQQTVRNLFFHVPMWFCMQTLFIVSVIYAIRFLANPKPVYDIYSLEFARTGLVFGILGINNRRYLGKLSMGKTMERRPKAKRCCHCITYLSCLFCFKRFCN